MNYFILSFNQLNIKQLFEIYKLRSQVFVVEQNCAYQDVDEKDLLAMHVLIYKKENPQKRGRKPIVPPGTYSKPLDQDYFKKYYYKKTKPKKLAEKLAKQNNDTVIDLTDNIHSEQ